MAIRKYTLIIAGVPKKQKNYYTSGWQAGSVIVHKMHASSHGGKVFWSCPMHLLGIAYEDRDIFRKIIEKMSSRDMGPIDKFNSVGLNKIGYFYDGYDKAISWSFKIERIFYDEEFRDAKNGMIKKTLSSKYRQYAELREPQLRYPETYKDRIWFLLSNIERLKEPVRIKRVKEGKYNIPGFKLFVGDQENLKTLNTRHFLFGGVAFARETPKDLDIVEGVDPVKIDDYLKQFFLNGSNDRVLKERAVQLAFAWELMSKHKAWTLLLEDVPRKGLRADIVFKCKDILYVVEVKRDDNDQSVDQLQKYINAYRRRAKDYKKIKGIIICSNPDKLRNGCKKHGFILMKYILSIEFPKEQMNRFK